MNPDTYYRDHWLEVETERLEAYEEMFRWRPQMEPLLAPARLEEGQVVVDYGCGPGMLSLELGRRAGAAGHVHGVDINAAFLARAREHAAESGLDKQMSFHLIEGDRVPLEDGSVDRVICKNVLEYVPDVGATLRELRRVLRPGGLTHATDSDWGMLVVEPLGADRIAELFQAASLAYKTPLIGRKLYGAFREAGYGDVEIQIVATADRRGFLAPVVFHMAGYARVSGRLDPAKIDRLLDDLRAAIEAGTYLMVLPQFLVTGTER
ncbi:MAG: methyltransferase domain-containing protein [Myxococcota bacterium]